MKRKFWIRKFLIFRLFRSLPESERIHIMSVLPKKNQHQRSVEELREGK